MIKHQNHKNSVIHQTISRSFNRSIIQSIIARINNRPVKMSQGMLRGFGQGGKKHQGSHTMAEELRLYFEHPTLTDVQALKLADFSKEEAN
jgi:hypothetical protein